MNKKIKKGDIISYRSLHDDSVEGTYFGKVQSNRNGNIKLIILCKPMLSEIKTLDSEDLSGIIYTVYKKSTKRELKKLLLAHAHHGLKEKKELLKNLRTVKHLSKHDRKSQRKGLKKEIKDYKSLEFFYPKLVEILLPD